MGISAEMELVLVLQPVIEYLGYRIDSERFHTTTAKFDAIFEVP